MTAVAVELFDRPPVTEDQRDTDVQAELDPDAIEFIADTDNVLTMCSCSASSDQVY